MKIRIREDANGKTFVKKIRIDEILSTMCIEEVIIEREDFDHHTASQVFHYLKNEVIKRFCQFAAKPYGPGTAAAAEYKASEAEKLGGFPNVESAITTPDAGSTMIRKISEKSDKSLAETICDAIADSANKSRLMAENLVAEVVIDTAQLQEKLREVEGELRELKANLRPCSGNHAGDVVSPSRQYTAGDTALEIFLPVEGSVIKPNTPQTKSNAVIHINVKNVQGIEQMAHDIQTYVQSHLKDLPL